MYMPGVITEGVKRFWISEFNRLFGVSSHACLCGKNCIYYVPSGPKDYYKISCGLLEVKKSLLVIVSDGLRPNITLFVGYLN